VVSGQKGTVMASVWQMNDEECFAAETLDDALKAMAEQYSYETTPEGIAAMRKEFGVDDPFALTEESLLRRKVNVACPDEGEPDHLVTFREHLDQLVKDGELPCMFSTTEY
jgi:hypothetical protein